MRHEKREILSQVATGTLSPEQAAVRLEKMEDTPAPPLPSAHEEPIRRVRVVGDFRTITVAGDPSVAGAAAEGPHTAHREGDTLVIDAETGEQEIEGRLFRFARARGPGGPRPRVFVGGMRPKLVSVVMNPDLALDVRVDAGTVTIHGVRGPIAGHVDAGSIRIDGFANAFDLSVDAGAVSVTGVLDRGDSRIRSDAGSIKVTLLKGSSVKVRAAADVGSIRLGNKGHKGIHIGNETHEAVFGAGAATLEITGGIGRVVVEEEG
jgi:hypothetical protein